MNNEEKILNVVNKIDSKVNKIESQVKEIQVQIGVVNTKLEGHDKQFAEIRENMVTKDEFYIAQDEILGRIERVEQEQTFTNAAIIRIEAKVEQHDKRLAVR